MKAFLGKLLHNKPRAVFWVIIVIFIIVTVYEIKVFMSITDNPMKKTNKSIGNTNDILDTKDLQMDNLTMPELTQFSDYYDNDTRDLFKQSIVSPGEKDMAKSKDKDEKKKEKTFPLEFNGVIQTNSVYVAILKEPATGKVHFKKENEQILDMYLRNIFPDRVILVKGNNSEEIELHRVGKDTGGTLNNEEGM